MTARAIPTLLTERLRLRPPVADDFPAYFGLMSSARSCYMGGPFDVRAAWGVFCHDMACWSLFGHGALMIDVRSTDRCAGQVSISHGPLFPEKELGWYLYDGCEGFGFATEAGAALRDWAAETLGLDNLVSYIDPRNSASIKVAVRLGAVLDPEACPQDRGDLVYRHHP